MKCWMSLLSFLLVFGLQEDAHAADSPTKDRPNILFFITDDQSWNHTSAEGDPVVKTPAFDRVAHEGVRFTHAFCAAPSCSPSRAAMLTGRPMWALETGGLLFGTIPAKYKTFPEMLGEVGYELGSTGKTWGPGSVTAGGRKQQPTGTSYQRKKIKKQEKVPGQSSLDYAGNFGDFLEKRDKNKPFLFWAGTSEPHRSYAKGAGAKSGKDPSKARVPASLPQIPAIQHDVLDYYMEVERADRELAGMLELLEKHRLLDNTLVIVTSDHGLPFPRGKCNLYDEGTRIPLAIRWPGHVKSERVVGDLVSATQFAGTILEAAGVKPDKGMIGKSFWGLATGKGDLGGPRADDFVVTGIERHTWCRPKGVPYPSRAIRTHDYLYIRNFEPTRWPMGDPDYKSPHQGVYGDIDSSPSKTYLMEHKDDPKLKKYFDLSFAKRPAEELYDLKKDPGQLSNVAGQKGYVEMQAKLKNQLMEHLKETGDPRAEGKSPWDQYPYYFRDFAKNPPKQ